MKRAWLWMLISVLVAFAAWSIEIFLKWRALN